MKLFSESFGRLLQNLQSVEGCGRNFVMGQSLKLVFRCFGGLYCVEGPYYGKAEVSGCAEEERCVEA